LIQRIKKKRVDGPYRQVSLFSGANFLGENIDGVAVEAWQIPSHWEFHVFPVEVVGVPSYWE